MGSADERLPLLSTAPIAVHTLQKPNDKGSLSLSQRLHALGTTHIPPRMQGVLLVAASAFTFSLLSALIKYASYSMPSMETVFWRSLVAWVLNLVRTSFVSHSFVQV